MDKTFIKDLQNMAWRIRVQQCNLILDAINKSALTVHNWDFIIDREMLIKQEALDIFAKDVWEYLGTEGIKQNEPGDSSFAQIKDLYSADIKKGNIKMEEVFVKMRKLFKAQINN